MNEHSGACKQSKQCRASKWVSCARKHTSRFLAVLNHCESPFGDVTTVSSTMTASLIKLSKPSLIWQKYPDNIEKVICWLWKRCSQGFYGCLSLTDWGIPPAAFPAFSSKFFTSRFGSVFHQLFSETRKWCLNHPFCQTVMSSWTHSISTYRPWIVLTLSNFRFFYHFLSVFLLNLYSFIR